MDYIDTIVNDLDQVAIVDMMAYSIPTLDDYNDTINVALELGRKLNVNLDVIKLGVRFVEVRLGKAIADKKPAEYVNMSLGFAMDFLTGYPISEDLKKKVLACIKEQNDKKFSCLEAEICTNAMCYNFLTPKKVLRLFYNLKQRGYNFDEIFLYVDEKTHEKWNKLTLDICKKDLEHNYKKIREFLDLARKDPVNFINFGDIVLNDGPEGI